jgi:enterochelin esterase-like enzyme
MGAGGARTDRELDIALPGATSHDVSDSANSPQPDLFLQTLREDIVPFVDQTYRTLPNDCCLYGYSWGGFFVLYTLLRAPDVFRRYIPGSGFVDPTTAGCLASRMNERCRSIHPSTRWSQQHRSRRSSSTGRVKKRQERFVRVGGPYGRQEWIKAAFSTFPDEQASLAATLASAHSWR